jgi:hypothetical protein
MPHIDAAYLALRVAGWLGQTVVWAHLDRLSKPASAGTTNPQNARPAAAFDSAHTLRLAAASARGSSGAGSSASTGLGACAFTHDRNSRVRRRDAWTQRGAYARRFRRGTSAFRLPPGLCLQRTASAAECLLGSALDAVCKQRSSSTVLRGSPDPAATAAGSGRSPSTATNHATGDHGHDCVVQIAITRSPSTCHRSWSEAAAMSRPAPLSNVAGPGQQSHARSRRAAGPSGARQPQAGRPQDACSLRPEPALSKRHGLPLPHDRGRPRPRCRGYRVGTGPELRPVGRGDPRHVLALVSESSVG